MAMIKKPKIPFFDKNPIEAAVRDISDGVVKSVKNDLMEQSITTAWEQLLKGDNPQHEANDKTTSGKANLEGEIFSKEKPKDVEPAINYRAEVLQVHEKASGKEQRELTIRLQEITLELKKLSSSVREIRSTVKDVDLEKIPENAGKYHLNFLEWLLMQLRNAQVRVQESASWMHVVSGKKQKKGYWNMAKKQGTSYTLSSERVVAQQVG